jgi:hypothetical protein
LLLETKFEVDSIAGVTSLQFKVVNRLTRREKSLKDRANDSNVTRQRIFFKQRRRII